MTESKDKPSTQQSIDDVAVLRADPTQISLADLPKEIFLLVITWVGPRTVLRLGVTCRGYRQAIDQYRVSLSYALSFAQRGIYHLENNLFAAHRSCDANRPDSILRARAKSYVERIVAFLSGSGANPAEWDLAPMLHFLYPMAIHVSGGEWAFAAYALDWCARVERRVLKCKDEAPREEILALLHPDALAKLVALADRHRWDMGITFARTAYAACSTITSATADPVIHILQSLAGFAVGLASQSGDVSLCAAIMAATCGSFPKGVALCSRTPTKLWHNLHNVGIGIESNKAPAEDINWLYLTGLQPKSKRSVSQLTKDFDCRQGGTPPDPSANHRRDPLVTMLTGLSLGLLLGAETPSIVAVPNAALGSVLADAMHTWGTDGANEDNDEDGNDELPELHDGPGTEPAEH